MTETMKAISLWQPWASLWLSPNKLHETRHWSTPYRGTLLVHAAKKFVKDVNSDLKDVLDDEFGGHWTMDLPSGVLLGAVDLVDCVPTGRIVAGFDWSDAQRIDNICGNFDDGRFGWRRGAYWKFRVPIAYRGLQGLFNVPLDVVREALAGAEKAEP